MEIMQVDSETNSVIDLTELARLLVTEGMPAQAIVAREAGVSQSTVSRVINRQTKGCSKGCQRLWKYVQSRSLLPVTFDENGAVRLKRKNRTGRRKNSVGITRGLTLANHANLAAKAKSTLKNYLDDAFDPQLVIEQLAVLRRAQTSSKR
jgi:lambda repressor-like predicted transcriptional regulator